MHRLRFSLPLPLLLAASAAAQVPAVSFLPVDDAPDADRPIEFAWTADGTALLVVHRDTGDLAFLDGATLGVTHLVPIGGGPLDVVTTPDGTLALVPCSTDDTLGVVDVASRTLVASVPLSGSLPYRVEVSTSSSFAVVALAGGSISVVDLASFQETASFPTAPQEPYPVYFSHDYHEQAQISWPRIDLAPDDRTLLVPSASDGKVEVWDVTTGALLHELFPSDSVLVPVAALADPAGARAAVLLVDTFGLGFFEVAVLDLATFVSSEVGLAFGDSPTNHASFALTPDGAAALVAGTALHVVDLATAQLVRSIADAGGDALGLDPSGTFAITTAHAPVARVTVTDLTLDVSVVVPTNGAAMRVSANPAGGRAALLHSKRDEEVALLDGLGGTPSIVARAPTGPPREADHPTAIELDASGRFGILPCFLSDNLCRLDLASGDRDWIPVGDRPIDAALDAGGRTAVVAHADGQLAVVDVETGVVEARFALQRARRLSLSPDEEQAWVLQPSAELVFVELDGAASRVLGTLALGSPLIYPQPYRRRLAAMPDGRLLVPVASDGTLVVVDGYGRNVLHTVDVGGSPIDAVVTPEGMAYVAGTGAGKVRRVDVSGVPVLLGEVQVAALGPFEVDEPGGYLYVAGSSLSVVDVTTMTVVREIPLFSGVADFALSLPFGVVALSNGTLVRFLAAGPDTEIVSTTPLAGVATDLVIAPPGGVVHAVEPWARDGVEVFDFRGATRFCTPANTNSTGLAAEIDAPGWALAGAPLVLTAEQMPPNELGTLLVADAPGFVPFFGGSSGNLCLSGSIGRFSNLLLDTGASGRFSAAIDTALLPQPGGAVAVQPGETWYFQAWFRDHVPAPTSHTTDGVGVTFE